MQKLIRNGKNEVVKQNSAGDLEYLTFPELERLECVKHLFSILLFFLLGYLNTTEIEY